MNKHHRSSCLMLAANMETDGGTKENNADKIVATAAKFYNFLENKTPTETERN